MTKVLITGGAGFIGFHLAKYLSKMPFDITIADNLSRGKRDRALVNLINKSNVTLIEVDLTKPKNYCLLDNNYDYIYHLAAINGTANFYKRPDEVLKVNIISLLYLLEWINKDKCKKLLLTSSSETYAGTIKAFSENDNFIPTTEDIPLTIDNIFNSRNSYAGSKIIGELLTINYCRKKKIPFNIVRYHNIYGPRMGYDHVIPQFCQRIFQKSDPFLIYGGKETRSFCYIDDGVKASHLVMINSKCNNQVFNIGNDQEEIAIYELAQRLLKMSNYTPAIEVKPAPAGSVKRRCPDLSKLFSYTDYQPAVSLERGLRQTYEWYLNEYKGLLS